MIFPWICVLFCSENASAQREYIPFIAMSPPRKRWENRWKTWENPWDHPQISPPNLKSMLRAASGGWDPNGMPRNATNIHNMKDHRDHIYFYLTIK